jgi:GTP-binding protein
VLAALSTEEADIRVTLFSSLKRQGVGDVAEILHDWVAIPTGTPEGTPDHDPAA